MEKATIKSEMFLDVTITLNLTLVEARALNEITKYGSKPFLTGFYKHLGKAYVGKYEKGIISLFDTIDKELPERLRKVDTMMKAINDALKPK